MNHIDALDKTFNPQAIEHKLLEHWSSLGLLTTTNFPDKKTFSIVIPPPNVTGSLHMGHAFQDTLMDILMRYHKMSGNDTLWQFGVDHAGIATQMVVERQLAAQNITRHDLGRVDFVKRIWQWKQQSDDMITQQVRRLGASIDWDRECFTMDPEYSFAVQKVFIDLYKEGLIYRGQRLVHWDPVLRTAISDLEVNHTEEPGSLYYIRYPIVNSHSWLVVATTRPETMFGDTAVAVNPTDDRYKHLIGQHLALPLSERLIPIIADTAVAMDFGTGCVKVTPAHDFNDYAMAKRHNLSSINIFTEDAKLNDNAPHKYQTLDRFIARKQIIADLEVINLLDKITVHTLKLPRGDRSGAILEPYLTNQWFVNIAPLKTDAIAAVKTGAIKFVPENWENTFFSWMNILEDWCISRQLWWGHRIPAWYDQYHNIYVGQSEDDIRQTYNLAANLVLRQDEDVLDTWFSSALWPFASLGWPNVNPIYNHYYPTSVLVTGFDIIFFWVARMIMFALKFTKQVPFKTVYIHGLIRDSYGQKMSKSKGNVLDPLDIIDGITLEKLLEKRTSSMMQPQLAAKIRQQTIKEFPEGIMAFGTDCLRFTFASLANTGRDINFDLQRTSGYRNFCNKLWNAARFILLHVDNTVDYSIQLPDHLSTIDAWIYSQLQTTIKNVHQHLASYRFDLAAKALYEFTWEKFCDWYLEFSKSLLNTNKEFITKHTLVHVLDNILRLLHPFMPFLTEEIWQTIVSMLRYKENSILQITYPVYNDNLINEIADAEITWLQNIVQVIRNLRSELNISPAKHIILHIKYATTSDKAYLAKYFPNLQTLIKVDNIIYLEDHEQPTISATGIVNNLEIFLPLTDLVDLRQESERLKKQLAKQQAEALILQARLRNVEFLTKAPPQLVAQEQQKLQNTQTAIQKLFEKIQWFS